VTDGTLTRFVLSLKLAALTEGSRAGGTKGLIKKAIKVVERLVEEDVGHCQKE
jgi:hypothetical protein